MNTYSPIKYPILHTRPSLLCFVLSFVPILFDLADETVFSIFGAFLGLVSFVREVALELSSIPIIIWLCNFCLPVVFDEIFEVFAISWRWVRDIVIREPAL